MDGATATGAEQLIALLRLLGCLGPHASAIASAALAVGATAAMACTPLAVAPSTLGSGKVAIVATVDAKLDVAVLLVRRTLSRKFSARNAA